jgi:transglutaminase-like putative cysteine protease
MADDLAKHGDTPVELARRISDAVHSAITYEYGVTSVKTTAAEALAIGRGVCQDFAHVMLAVCHLVGLPARYVSGHLLGQGGTHAWVEVVVPQVRGGSAPEAGGFPAPEARGAEAIAFDPCNGRRAGSGYVTVATGRDYSDVAPTSGSYVGAASGRLTADRRVGILAASG